MTKRILVVDDDSMYIELIANLLAPRNVTIIPASDGAVALKALESQPVDLIISDFNMPIMDGMMLHQRVSDDKRFNNTPFVFITGALEPKLVAYTGRFAGLTIILKSEIVNKLGTFVKEVL